MGKKRSAKKARKWGGKTYKIFEEMRPTPEDWYPNYPENMVRISAYWNVEKSWGRICVRGADDTGMERDFDDREFLERVIKQLPVIIMRRDLEDLGFLPA